MQTTKTLNEQPKSPPAVGCSDLLAEITRLEVEETKAWHVMREKESALARATDELREATRAWGNAYSKAKTAVETYKSANKDSATGKS